MPIEKAKHCFREDARNPLQKDGTSNKKKNCPSKGKKKTAIPAARGGCPVNQPMVPHAIEIDYLDGNPVCVTLLKKNVSLCVGCSKKFFPHHRQAPLNMVFQFMCRRMRPDGAGKWFKGKCL